MRKYDNRLAFEMLKSNHERCAAGAKSGEGGQGRRHDALFAHSSGGGGKEPKTVEAHSV